MLRRLIYCGLPQLWVIIYNQEQRIRSSLCSVTFVTVAVKTLTLVLFYYVFSIGLTFYNRHLFKDSNLALSVTMCHMVIKFLIASLARFVWECKTKSSRIVLDWDTFIRCIAPAGVLSSLDIGLSNWSFEMITVSLYTMSKSTAVIFILFFSLLFRLETFRWSLIIGVFFIFSGLMMFTYESTQFDLTGFLLVMTASVLAGIRWTLTQILLQKEKIGLQHPLDMMYHIQPWMMLALFPLWVGVEGTLVSTTDEYFAFSEWSVLMGNIAAILFGGFLGFMLEFSEFLLLCHTSSLTLSVSGVFKESGILALDYLINREPMSSVNLMGLVLCLLGISVHVITNTLFRPSKPHSHVVNKTADIIVMLRRSSCTNGVSPQIEPDSSSDNNR